MLFCCYGKKDECMATIPDKNVMNNIIDRICVIETKLKNGDHLTRLEESEKKELAIVVKAMKHVQNNSLSRLGDLAHISPSK